MIVAPLQLRAEISATSGFVSPDEIRLRFSGATSSVYRREVPQYGTLLREPASLANSVESTRPGQFNGARIEQVMRHLERRAAE